MIRINHINLKVFKLLLAVLSPPWSGVGLAGSKTVSRPPLLCNRTKQHFLQVIKQLVAINFNLRILTRAFGFEPCSLVTDH